MSLHQSQTDEAANRKHFFLGGSGVASTDFSATSCLSLSRLVTEAHTSPPSGLGMHLRSLNFGSNAVAILRYVMLAFCLHVSRSPLNVYNFSEVNKENKLIYTASCAQVQPIFKQIQTLCKQNADFHIL